MRKIIGTYIINDESTIELESHYHRYQWVYIVETKYTDDRKYFEAYWFKDKLEYAKTSV